MKIALVHYHLRRGGVTRVMETTLDSLRAEGVRTVVLLGEEPSRATAERCGPVRVVDGLGYDRPGAAGDPEALADRMRAAAREALGGAPDVWHVHNHALGKNAALPQAVVRLAADGHRFLLHIHDFAEDGRPANYRHLRRFACSPAALYPTAPGIQYAVLNDRDHQFLLDAGSPPERTHLLPNPVALEPSGPALPPASPPLFLYPTRAIRRKNLGEFLLWSALAAEGERFAVTLAPQNPAARPIYEDWVGFGRALDLPVAFEAGARATPSFPALMREAVALVTTAVAEGFGLAFLEPWLVDRPVVGRDLPEITRGFVAQGIRLDALYERLACPLGWVGGGRLRAALGRALTRARAAYGRDTGTEHVDGAYGAAVHGDRVDFGRLDEAMQQEIIRRVRASPAAAREIDPPRLRPAPMPDAAANRDAVRRAFCPDTYSRRLRAVYARLAGAPTEPPGTLDAGAILDAFLDPARFFLLRT